MLANAELIQQVILLAATDWSSDASRSALGLLLDILATDERNVEVLFNAHSEQLIPALTSAIGSSDDAIVAAALRILCSVVSVGERAKHVFDNFPDVFPLLLDKLEASISVLSTTMGSTPPAAPDQVYAAAQASARCQSFVFIAFEFAKVDEIDAVVVSEHPRYVALLVQLAGWDHTGVFAGESLLEDALASLSTAVDGKTPPYGMVERFPDILPSLIAKQLAGDLPLFVRSLSFILMGSLVILPENTRTAMMKHGQELVPLLVAAAVRPLSSSAGVPGEVDKLCVVAYSALHRILHHSDLAVDVFAKHGAELLPILVLRLSSTGNTPGVRDIQVLSAKILYQLSCAPSNQPVMREHKDLVPALRQQLLDQPDPAEDGTGFDDYCLLALINVMRAVDNKPGLMADSAMCVRLMRMLDVGVNLEEKHLTLVHSSFAFLMGFRNLFASKPNRDLLWASDGASKINFKAQATLHHLVDASGTAQSDKNFVGAEHAIATLLHFSADTGGPLGVICKSKPRIECLVASMDEGKGGGGVGSARPSAASKAAAKLLLQRLVDAAPPPDEVCRTPSSSAVSREEEFARSQLLIHVHVRTSVRQEKWSDFMAKMKTSTPAWTPELLGCLLQLGAPLRVIEFLVRDKRCNVNKPALIPREVYPFPQALLLHRLDVALLFLDASTTANKFDVRQLYSSGLTPLMQSCVDSSFLPVTKRLVELNSPLDHVPASGRSALSLCCSMDMTGGVDQARCLLEAGASPSLGDRNGITPLYIASSLLDLPMTKLLLEYGADTRMSASGKTLLHAMLVAADIEHATESALIELLELLVKHGAPVGGVSSRDQGELSPLQLFYARQRASPLRVTRRWVELGGCVLDLLSMAAAIGRAEDVAWFLQMGGDPNHVNHGNTALQAAFMIHPQRAGEGVQIGILRTLILAGAAVDGEPLANAIATGNVALVKLLLQAGANKRGTYRGQSMFAYAVSKGAVSKSVLALLAADDGSNGVAPEPCGQFDDDGEGLRFVFTHCAGCRKRGDGGNLQGCSGCVMVAYCGEECQHAHWNQHKKVCKKKRAMDEMRSKVKS